MRTTNRIDLIVGQKLALFLGRLTIYPDFWKFLSAVSDANKVHSTIIRSCQVIAPGHEIRAHHSSAGSIILGPRQKSVRKLGFGQFKDPRRLSTTKFKTRFKGVSIFYRNALN